jgi:hypothetical protein
MSEEHSANKVVVEIHVCISQVFIWNVIHIFFLVTLCMFISYGKDVCNRRHTCEFFRCVGVECSVCMYCSPVKNWNMTIPCDSVYHQHIMQVIGTVLLIHGHPGPSCADRVDFFGLCLTWCDGSCSALGDENVEPLFFCGIHHVFCSCDV